MDDLDFRLEQAIQRERNMQRRRELVPGLFFALMFLVYVLHSPWESFWVNQAAKDCVEYNRVNSYVEPTKFKNGNSVLYKTNLDYTEFTYSSPDATNMIVYIDSVGYFAGVAGEWKSTEPFYVLKFCRRSVPGAILDRPDPRQLHITEYRNPQELIHPAFQVIILAFVLLNITLLLTGTFKDFWWFSLGRFYYRFKRRRS